MGNVGFIFSPDGAKSSYEIGCIKAIKELNGEVSFVSGNFLGSINAVLMASGDIDNMIRFWRSASKLRLQEIVGKVAGMYLDEWANYEHSRFIIKFLTFVTSEDKDMQDFRKLLGKYVDEEKVRNSEIKCSVIGISPYTFRPEVYPVEKIPKGQMTDYIMCSALYPMESLAGSDYHIGIPYEFSSWRAMEMFSPTLIISTDEVSERGEDNLTAKLIKPSKMIRSLFSESAEDMIRNIRLGYVDTLREVSFSYGNIFYINKLTDENSLKERVRSDIPQNKKDLLTNILRLKEYSPEAVTERIIAMASGAGLRGSDAFLSLTENAADILGVEKSDKYTDKTLREALVKRIEAVCEEVSEDLNNEEYVLKIVSDTELTGFLSPRRVTECFLILYATGRENYPLVKKFVGSLHLKVILAIVVMIYLV